MSFSKEELVRAKEYVREPARCPIDIIQAYGHIAAGGAIPPELTPATIEAQGFINDTKAEHYARLGAVMDILLDRMHRMRSERPPHGLVETRERSSNQWLNFRNGLVATAVEDIQAIKSSPEYEEAAISVKTIGRLDPRRFDDLAEQLKVGTSSAAVGIFNLLENFPAIIRHYNPECPQSEWIRIAHNSTNLVTKLSQRSSLSMVAARDALAITENGDRYSGSSYNPQNFQPIYNGEKISAIKFRDLDGLLDSTNMVNIIRSELEADRYVPDLPESQKVVIGCPIVLLPGRLQQMWDWGIDIVDKAGAWDKAS